MGFIYFLIGLAIGYNLIVFGGFQILSTFFTSIPTTARMKKMGYSVDKNIYGRFAFVIILWAVILSIVTIVISLFFNVNIVNGYLIGALVGFVISSGRVFPTAANVSDFLGAYGQFISQNTDEIFQETVKITYCKKCGNQLNKNKKCESCGKQYFSASIFFKRIVAFVCVLSLCFSIYAAYYIYDTEATNRAYKQTFSEYQNPITGESIYDAKSYLDAILAQEELLSIVYTYRGGPSYHYKDCELIKSPGTVINKKTIDQAEEEGYTPCTYCMREFY